MPTPQLDFHLQYMIISPFWPLCYYFFAKLTYILICNFYNSIITLHQTSRNSSFILLLLPHHFSNTLPLLNNPFATPPIPLLRIIHHYLITSLPSIPVTNSPLLSFFSIPLLLHHLHFAIPPLPFFIYSSFIFPSLIHHPYYTLSPLFNHFSPNFPPPLCYFFTSSRFIPLLSFLFYSSATLSSILRLSSTFPFVLLLSISFQLDVF